MKIISFETSCDETGVTILDCQGGTVKILGNALASQVQLHAKYGGVFPALAKRAHAEKIIPLLKESLEHAGMLIVNSSQIPSELREEIYEVCKHEEGLAEQIINFTEKYSIPEIDHIAVTSGPGLEPALWVGINTATALSKIWQKSLSPINHMEGHVISAIFEKHSDFDFKLHELHYPALSLLVSGGHTELILIDKPLSYKKIGHTKDDAVGEAFDKTARILGLPYPGGPKISALAKEAREEGITSEYQLPRPMLHSSDYNFSYSGLKTAVLYLIRDLEKDHSHILENMRMKKMIAREFEEAAIEVLVKKTKKAVEEFNIQTLIVGGGVANNDYLREQLTSVMPIKILFPTKELTTDNSVMIGMALYYQLLHKYTKTSDSIRADGNLSI